MTAGSGAAVWWRCDHHHEWEAAPNTRVQRGSGCPYCSGRIPVPGETDLVTAHPEKAAWWSPNNAVGPETVSSGSGYMALWQCPAGHEWSTRVALFVRHGTCPVCTARVRTETNDLPALYPGIARTWDTTKNGCGPELIAPGNETPRWWRCEHGHSWQTTPSHRVRGHGCPVCSNRRTVTGVNDLGTTHPGIAAQWSGEGVSPSTVTAGSVRLLSWRCSVGHEWETSPAARVSRGDGCPVCSGRKVVPGFNDLATVNPDLASQMDDLYLAPTEVTYGSNRKVRWRCADGHHWYTQVSQRSRGRGCPVCSNLATVPGVNDLATLEPDLAAQWAPGNDRQPCDVVPGSTYRARWRCLAGKRHPVWEAAVRERATNGRTGCPRCVHHVSSGETEVAEYLRSILPAETVIRTSDRRVIAPKELDIYLPQQQVAVEYHGLYWHSEERGGTRERHLAKVTACRAAGIRLIQVWEDDWRDRRSVVEAMLASRLGVDARPRAGARTLAVTDLTRGQARTVTQAHHIQGFTAGTLYLGLVDSGGEPLAVLITRQIKNQWYIERYAAAVKVPGGFGRLLAALERRVAAGGGGRVVTFSDNEVSDGKLYADTGFTAEAVLPPDYRYVDRTMTRRHKFGFRLARFRRDPALVYVEGLTERELAQVNGLARVWDSGKVRWVRQVPAAR